MIENSLDTSRTNRRRYVWFALLVLVLGSIWFLVVVSSRPEFEFIDKHQGIRDTKLQQNTEGLAYSFGGVPLGAMEIRSYTFKTSAKSVLDAIQKELLTQGWTHSSNSIGAEFSKDGQLAMYDTTDLTETEGATCSVTLSNKANWVSRQLRALKVRLGLEP